MLKKLFKTDKNVITLNVDYFRELLEEEDDDINDKIIKSIIKMNKKILSKYEKFIYIISTESINVNDLYYCNFAKKVILEIQDLFAYQIEMMKFINTSETFKYIFSFISIFIKEEILKKIKFE
jgi:hypothetical protein